MNDWAAVSFERNGGRPMQHDGEDHFVPLVCLYRFSSAFAAHPVFQGCFNNASGDPDARLPRADTPDEAFAPGAEVFFASAIAVQYLRATGGVAPAPIPPAAVAALYLASADDAEDEEEAAAEYCTDVAIAANWFRPFLRIAAGVARAQSYRTRTLEGSGALLHVNGSSAMAALSPCARALVVYFRAFPARDYDSFRPYLAPQMTFEVVELANYTGAEVVYRYQLLADFHISDTIRVSALTRLAVVGAGHLCLAQVMMDSDFPNTPGPLSIWNNKYAVRVEMDRYGRMAHFQQHVNLMGAFIRRAPGAGTPNITAICAETQARCTDAVAVDAYAPVFVSARQYASAAECEAYFHSIPLMGPTVATQVTGLSVACAQWHLGLVRSYPEHHCLHVGPQRISPQLTPCQDFTTA